MKFPYQCLLLMVVVTVAVVQSFQLWGDQKRLVLTSEQFKRFATNDQQDGGQSLSTLTANKNQVQLSCELKSSDYPWPYCGLSIHLTDDASKGKDLSAYHTLEIELDYPQPLDAEKSLRLYLRNYNPAYSNLEDEYTHKYNGITLNYDNQRLSIPIKNFQVMTWWLVDNKIPLEFASPEYSNVTKFELATGSNSALGDHQITIKNITLIGRYIEGEGLFLMLLVIWVIAATSLIMWEFRKHHRDIERSQQRTAHLARLNQRLVSENIRFAELAHKDALTGIRNRHAVREWLDSYQESTSTHVMSILFIDIDYFKSINDTYGHSVGDDVLREFAVILSEFMTEPDIVVRWGGEEFVIFCIDKNRSLAEQEAEKIRQKVSSHLWVHGDPLTCSIGVSDVYDGNVYAAITQADNYLYRAKQAGRNCVVAG
ncbi:sensor domain-containing diguanylate cyclase [Vibrio methylphosphonaticus]|uniref:sensor domain-containing diguanylate cyclase n=1 Tax=Vibrio methylphosphonaticus TaxID=2946866 RepID=UPI00202A9156|nr:sensor domain-containing diguanylate cyclase [Vibrio methylphosphonaticus]MCL9774849.1 diguanylate cyclase [Vibrio methylphosphonaticus]